MEYVTKKCGAAGHTEISISVADGFPLSGEWMCDFFESEVSKGQVFRAEETVQIGWMVTILKERDSGMLEVWEPDFVSMPIRWRRGATNTLRHLAVQRAVCEAFECTPLLPSLQEAAVVGKSFFNSSSDFIMSRDQPAGADSGWLFRSPHDESIVSEYKSLYEVALARPCVIPYLALPPGSNVSGSATSVALEYENRGISSHENDMLRKIVEEWDR